MILIRSRIAAGLLVIESDEVLSGIVITDRTGKKADAPVLGRKPDGEKHVVFIDASSLQTWSPDHPVLYTLEAESVSQRFGYCELATLGNRAVLLNGTPCFLRGYIRGIVAHDHPNMTGGAAKDAAVKNIRQARKYGFNLVRFHSTVPAPEFVEAADEEGLLIHMEIGFSYEYDAKGNKKKLSMDNARWRETILRYRNNPSAAIFCIGNEMHNSGRRPEVRALYEEGKRLAPAKLIMDNSGWGEFDRESADIFSQHIAYYFPFKHHAKMFETDDCWRINGSAYDGELASSFSGSGVDASIRREAVPIRPVLAHEAIHYIDIPDYAALNRKFDGFCSRVGRDYLEANGIKKPRYLTELPALIERKKLSSKMPDYIQGSRIFKKTGIKTYIERLRLSHLAGFEMLQLSDCLKYENKNGILDCFDDDKYFEEAWMKSFNGDAALLADFGDETFFYDTPVTMKLFVSDFLEQPVRRGTVTVAADGETVWTGKDVVLAGNLQKIAELTLKFKNGDAPKKITVTAKFESGGLVLENTWPLWLYPHAAPAVRAELDLGSETARKFFSAPRTPAENLFITDRLNGRVLTELEKGRHVLLLYHRDRPGNEYYLPGALERFKPCIWDRGSNLGGFVTVPELCRALATERYFDANMQPLLEGAYKVDLDGCPLPVAEHVSGIDKPVRDRMKGLLHGIKDFIDDDTLRNFSHCFSVSADNGGVLTVCTLNFNGAPVTENFFAALVDNARLFRSERTVSVSGIAKYFSDATAAGVRKEDVMNHFWELDDKPVEDTLFWEETGIDLSKIK
ncbi:MAG: hypothetical protein IJU70_03165 [Lentisphaeria bacterium]|nr:hypothetical protein [Lentisphaeria bacterium]